MFELPQRVFVGEVHDVDSGVCHVGDGDGAMGGFRFRVGGAAVRMIVRRGLALGDHARDHDVDHAAILRVHTAKRIHLAGFMHDLEHQPVVDHEHVGVGHEELER